MERVFQIASAILAVVAAYFLWTGNKDGAFVSVVIACVAFFLSVRSQVKERNRLRQAEPAEVPPENDAENETRTDAAAGS